jgi:DNA-binding cell septation regulator SpoVG
MDNLPKLDARVRPYQDQSSRPTRLMAFADLVIADSFVIRNIRVLKKAEGDDAPFVVFPAEKGKGALADRWFDLAHPVTLEARNAAIGLILEKYQQASAGGAALRT